MAALPSGEQITPALAAERDHARKGTAYRVREARVREARREAEVFVVDEALEGCHAVWGDEGQGRGETLHVNPDAGEIILCFPASPHSHLGATRLH